MRDTQRTERHRAAGGRLQVSDNQTTFGWTRAIVSRTELEENTCPGPFSTSLSSSWSIWPVRPAAGLSGSAATERKEKSTVARLLARFRGGARFLGSDRRGGSSSECLRASFSNRRSWEGTGHGAGVAWELWRGGGARGQIIKLSRHVNRNGDESVFNTGGCVPRRLITH